MHFAKTTLAACTPDTPLGRDALWVWRSPTQASGGGDREERIDPEKAESKEFLDSVPKGDKSGSRTAIGFDLELLGGIMLSFLRQTQG